MITHDFYKRSVLSTLAFLVFFSGSLNASAAAFSVSQKPLMLTETVPPNMLLTLDDSGSMRWAFAPDEKAGARATRRAKSTAFNPMYYNPEVTYVAPKMFSAYGVEQELSTSFTAALHNGFNSARGSVNLSNDYKVHWTYDPHANAPTTYGYSNTSPRLAENPSADFPSCYVTSLNVGQSKTCSSAGRTVTITRTANTGGWNSSINCTASASDLSDGVCSYDNNSKRYTGSWLTAGVPAYYYTYDPSLADNCTTANDDCYRLNFVSETQQQNFANWYSFYRNRALATISATALAFYDLSTEVRLSWQGLGNCKSFTSTDGNGNCGNNAFKNYSSEHKGQLYTWLRNIEFDQSTYLPAAMRRAGDFYGTARAWEKNPGGSGNTTDNTYACRPSYHVMMTDGLWNQSVNAPGSFLHDNTTFKLPDGQEYKGQNPFKDTNSDNYTLADLAMHYWATDLRPTLPNEVSPYIHTKDNDPNKQYWNPRNDPATWQHMVNFMMGLGLTEALDNPKLPWEGATHTGAGYEALLKGQENWPKAEADLNKSKNNNVYDLWHAALNSRGEFFSVDSPEAMVKAFKEILNRIEDRTATAARPAVSASFVADSDGGKLKSNVYATQFSSDDWSGELSKTQLVGGQIKTLWSTKTANQGINPLTRNVMMAAPDAVADNRLVSFNWGNLGDLQDLLDVNPESLVGAKDGRGEERVDYIRGDSSLEGDSETSFRRRNSDTVIGDIINSSPVIVGTPAYLAYLADAIEAPDRENYKNYSDFRELHRKRVINPDTGTVVSGSRKEMIYVGGNDGMLHGFNADTGKEEFAFIPTEVIKNLYRLTGKNYSGGEHHYFVDGSPIVRDVYLSDDLGWRTVLIGTLRAGGKALFALDVTDPDNIELLWEFDSMTDEDLGYSFAQPEIVRLHTGEWAVLQGNGYDSVNDKAALLIIDIANGDLIKKITVPDVVEEKITLPNGLSSVRGADNNGDGLVDYAYAGDLQGNVWRFDLVKPTDSSEFEIEQDGQTTKISDPFNRHLADIKSTTHADFKLAYGGNPLFTARDSTAAEARQAITIQPSLVRHPSSHGYLVLIGTGKYFEHSDANVDTSRAMTLYGIWDRKTKRQPTDTYTLRAGDRSNLKPQAFTSQSNSVQYTNDENQVLSTRDIRLLSSKTPEWYKDSEDFEDHPDYDNPLHNDNNVLRWGWSLDMAVGTKLEGEMIINNMTVSGSILFLSSLTPNQDPCQAGADTWLYAVDAYSGGRTRFNVIDLNADQIVDTNDEYNSDVVSGMRFPALGGFTLAPGNLVFGSDGAKGGLGVADDPNTNGRQSWHIIPEKYQ
ncbi:pilus assembly protein [Stutzerimonas kunmingensis]|uniref:pilus assembly protein n=1 Tax=Stutzerimonas kunmingensis TaxID=1211807 RepID=UPI0028A7C8C3|nr:PilC/PilY family type IV pilus protein [Stutzerimonas kunmingensis]